MSTTSEVKSLRIALIGNVANNFFREAFLLRKKYSLNVDCYVSSADLNSNLPSNPNSDLIGANISEYSWLKEIPYNKMGRRFWIHQYFPRISKVFMSKFAKSFFKELSSYDVCFYSGREILLLSSLKNIGIIRPTGSDLTVLPIFNPNDFKAFRTYSVPNQNNKIKNKLKDFIFLLLQNFIVILQKRAYLLAYKKAEYVVNSGEGPFLKALEKIGISLDNSIHTIPLGINLDIFKKLSEPSNILMEFDLDPQAFLVFLPSRIMIKDSPLHQETGQWKASDIAIKGFTNFLNKLPEDNRRNTFLLIPDRTLSDNLSLAKNLINDLRINENVLFLKGKNEAGLTRTEMIPIYSKSSVVLDDFGVGWYGSVVVEALACECPVITYIAPRILDSFSWHPFLIAKSEEEISNKLLFLFNNPDVRNSIGRKSREWTSLFHSHEKIYNSYMNIINIVTNKKN